MYQKCFQFTRQFSFICLNKSLFQKVSHENYTSKRWAGHSKWQNIKNTKQAMDRAKSVTFSKLTRQIDLAVKEGGDDMSKNEKLKTLWEEAKKISMPKSTFDHAIKASNQINEKSYWTVFSGPRGIVLGFEVMFANKTTGFLQSKFSPQLRKLKLKIEPHFNDLCTEKGIIIADPLPHTDNVLEKAVEDAIEIGMDEVFESDDKALIFECLPDRVDSFQQKLENKGYTIHSASTELEFKEFIKLKEEEIQDLETVINKLKNLHTEIIRASYNAEQTEN